MDIFNIISAFGLSASAGLNAYIPLLVISLLARYTHLIELKSPWDALTSWWVIGVLLALSVVEVLADKIPAVNHGYYILQANHIVGLTERQQMIIASIVRYHRRGTPFYDGLIETKLVQKDRRIVMILTSILRLADEMDASHTQRVMDVLVSTTSEKTVLRLVGKGDLTLEKWAVSKRASLFTDLFGNPLEILA